MVENVSPQQAWEGLQSDPRACVVDVRTHAEWTFIGVPDLDGRGRPPVMIPWQIWPGMQVNPGFLGQLQTAGVTADQPVYFLCRTGGRSLAAALAAEAAGYARCFNVSDGFEGAIDAAGHRGRLSGWKAAGLPWRQS